MKLIIDIADDQYKAVQDGMWCGSLYEELKNGIPVEPCEDCISREAVMKLLNAGWWKGVYPSGPIAALPSVTPMQMWIPVTERLPEEAVSVLIYAERNAYDGRDRFRKKVIDIGWQVDGKWHIDGCNGVVGIAWMPLPLPYKAESEG